MASGFTPGEDTCEGCHTKGEETVSYRVECKHKLCQNCACERKCSIIDIDRTIKVSCANHETNEATVFCKTHCKFVCHGCAFQMHQKPCDTKEILDEVNARLHQLRNLIRRGKDKQIEFKEDMEGIEKGSKHIERHMTALKEKKDSFVNLEMQKVNNDKENMDIKINREADDEIRKINANRKRRLKQNMDYASRHLEWIQKEKDTLSHDCRASEKHFQTTINTVKDTVHERAINLDETLSKAQTLVKESDVIVKEFEEIVQALTNYLKHEDYMVKVNTVIEVAEKVSFHRAEGHVIGEICLSDAKWDEETLMSPAIGLNCDMIGSIGTDKVVLKKHTDSSTHVANLKEKTLKRVNFRGNVRNDLCCCTATNDGRMVFGTNNGEIVIVDEAWRHVKTVNTRYDKCIKLSVDIDGLILAVASEESDILVYDPNNEIFLDPIVVRDRKIQDLHALSTRDIALRCTCSEGKELCVIDRSGFVKTSTHPLADVVGRTAIDRSCDAMYVSVFRKGAIDGDDGTHTVEMMSCNNLSVAEKIVEFRSTSSSEWFCPSVVPQNPGKLVIYREGKFVQYSRKTKDVDEIFNIIN